jgi:acyl-CoA thioester hydrolase
VETFDYEYRVRYSDTDKMGIAYYGRYLEWFEAARTEYLRVLGFPYNDYEKQGIFLPVAETGVRYFRPSTYDDLLTVRTSVAELGRSSVRFEYEVWGAGEASPRVTGFTVLVFVNASMRPIRMPDSIRSLVVLHPLSAALPPRNSKTSI